MIPVDEINKLFPDFEPGLIKDIAATCSLRNFQDGDVLMKTGSFIRYTMVIISGLVKVLREDDDGNEYFMYYIEPGQACALSMTCANKQNMSEITARAVGDVELMSVPLEKMDVWMMQYKSWYQFVLGTYRKRFEEMLTTLDHVAFRNMDERLAFYLKENSKKLKTNIIPFTHAEIAGELNSSREVISRLMKKMADRGMIKMNRNEIEIVNLDNF
jgi:CRP/FNR family transcriptional regulator, anaerobic regulatory protein